MEIIVFKKIHVAFAHDGYHIPTNIPHYIRTDIHTYTHAYIAIYFALFMVTIYHADHN